MRFDLPSFLTGTAIVAAIAIVQPMQVSAKTAKEVAQVAVPTTVRIDNPLGIDKGGSGVIIAKTGNTYTVLTANHVVKNPNVEYTVYTSKKKVYKVTSVISLQKTDNAPDLAIIKFDSAEDQAVAPISNSDEASIGSGIYISGYPIAIDSKTEREYEFTAGQVTSRRDQAKEGYGIRYDALTRRGMSGGPVFDVNGRVVGVHGQGDREGIVKNESAVGVTAVELKTGFNAAIPINTFTTLMPQVGLKESDIAVDNTPPENVAAVQPSRQEVKSWEQDFALSVGVGVLRQLGVPIPFFGGFGF